MKKSFLVWGVLAALFSSTAQARRGYQYSINPYRAEEILAGIQLNQPMAKERWLSLLGGKRDEKYTIQSGDTLWTVSEKTVGDPRLWRKIWAMNPQLPNPHDLPIGQILSYYQEGLAGDQFQVPLVRLVPNKPGAATDLDSDAIVNLDIKNQYRPSFFMISENEVLGQVTGAHSHRQWLGNETDLYIKFVQTPDPAPKTLSVVRIEKEVYDPYSSGSPSLGVLVRLVAEVKLEGTSESLTKASILRQLGVIERGDSVVASRDPLPHAEILHPPQETVLRVVRGEVEGAQMLSQGQIVLVNKGSSEGMKRGFLFRVVQDEDSFLKSTREVLKDYKGEIQLIAVSELASVGLILRNISPIQVGDTLLAAQNFADPPPRPRRELRELEFD